MSSSREQVCALADGHLRGEAFAEAVTLVTGDSDARATWHAYHVVGDVLRSGDGGGWGARADDAGFVARFQQRLALDALTTSPSNLTPFAITSTTMTESIAINNIADNTYSTGARGIKTPEKHSSNDSSFRWKLLAGAASLAAVTAIGWGSLSTLGAGGAATSSGAAQMAQMTPTIQISPQGQAPAAPVLATAAASESSPPVMIRDPHLDALLAAHKQVGGASALQMPSGFLRNATFEPTASGR